jgi:hypothetical protein
MVWNATRTFASSTMGKAGSFWPVQDSNGFETKPQPVPSIAFTFSIPIVSHANMHIRC